MATTFLEPGGDATGNVELTSNGGFYQIVGGSVSVATDFVHGTHINSIKCKPNSSDGVTTPAGVIADSGSRVSFYLYIVTLPNATASLSRLLTSLAGSVVFIRLTSAGVLQLWNGSSAQIGTNGSTLSTGIWYRISLAYTISSTSVNRFELFKNGISDISVTNATITNIVTSEWAIGNSSSNLTFDFRISDLYADNSSSLIDPGDIWVTAKRPNANGTINGFTTQIGAGGSGYGTGHSPQVNERPLSITNGWSIVGVGSAVTEEYNIESKSTGDINISIATIVDWLGWISIKALVGETVQVILDNINNAQAITSTATIYTKIKGSSTYPAGTGADIGIITDTSLTTVSLYECGILVAYIPAPYNPFHYYKSQGFQ